MGVRPGQNGLVGPAGERLSREARDTAGEAPALPRVSVPGFSLALNVAQVYNLGFAGFCKLETCATREGLWQGRAHTQSVRSKVRYWIASLT